MTHDGHWNMMVIETWWSLKHDGHWNMMVIETWWSLKHDGHWNMMVIETWWSLKHDGQWNMMVIETWWSWNMMVMKHDDHETWWSWNMMVMKHDDHEAWWSWNMMMVMKHDGHETWWSWNMMMVMKHDGHKTWRHETCHASFFMMIWFSSDNLLPIHVHIHVTSWRRMLLYAVCPEEGAGQQNYMVQTVTTCQCMSVAPHIICTEWSGAKISFKNHMVQTIIQ